MEVEISKFCGMICSEDFKCHWEEMEHRIRYMFPDGTTQTCVGSQVRCGCTLAMSLVSHITYEHPTAVMLSVIFIFTILIYLTLRCVLTQHACFCFGFGSGANSSNQPKNNCILSCTLPTPRDMAISTFAIANNTGNSNDDDSSSNNLGGGGPEEHSIFVIYSDKPPAYSKAVEESESESKSRDRCWYEDNTPPPSYSDILRSDKDNDKNSSIGGPITNHI